MSKIKTFFAAISLLALVGSPAFAGQNGGGSSSTAVAVSNSNASSSVNNVMVAPAALPGGSGLCPLGGVSFGFGAGGIGLGGGITIPHKRGERRCDAVVLGMLHHQAAGVQVMAFTDEVAQALEATGTRVLVGPYATKRKKH